MRRRILHALLVGSFGVIAFATPAVAAASAKGHRIDFEVRSPDSDTVCVSWYRTTSKDGPGKDPAGAELKLQEVPWSVRTETRKKVGHWRITAWATDDCRSTADPSGTVVCRISVDGKVRVKQRAKDAIAFCSI